MMIDKFIKDRNVRYGISALILFFGVWFASPERNFLQSVPFLVLFAVVGFSIHNVFTDNFIAVFLSALFMFYIETFSFSESIISTVIILLIFTLSYLSFRLYKRNKIYSAAVFIFALLAFAVVNGNAVSNLSHQKSVHSYLDTKPYGGEVKIQGTRYDFKAREYLTETAFSHSSREVMAFFSVNDTVTDGYQEYIKYNMLEDRRLEMLKILMANTDESEYSTRSAGIALDRDFLLTDSSEEYAAFMDFEIALNDCYNKEIFAGYCEEICSALSGNGFVYNTITFFGENGGEFVYQMTASSEDGYAGSLDKVELFDRDSFVFYSDEKQLHPYWKYIS